MSFMLIRCIVHPLRFWFLRFYLAWLSFPLFLLLISSHLFENIDQQVGDLGFASELGNYAEYSGAPNEEEVLQYARVVIDVSNFAIPKLCIIKACFEKHNQDLKIGISFHSAASCG